MIFGIILIYERINQVRSAAFVQYLFPRSLGKQILASAHV